MSEALKAVIYDGATNKTIERKLNKDELQQLAADQAEAAAQQAEADAKAAARDSALAKLADLGLTAEEIAAL